MPTTSRLNPLSAPVKWAFVQGADRNERGTFIRLEDIPVSYISGASITTEEIVRVFYEGHDPASTASQRQDVENLLGLYNIGFNAGNDPQRGDYLEFNAPAAGNWQRPGFIASLRIAISEWYIQWP